MDIKIIRRHTTRYGTDGRLFVDGNYVCDTAENPHSHLPAGTYDVILRKQRQWQRKMPQLIPKDVTVNASQSIPQSTSQSTALLAFGNGLCNVHDCRIYVGKHRVSGLVIHSYDTFINLYDRINASLRRGNTITLTITEE